MEKISQNRTKTDLDNHNPPSCTKYFVYATAVASNNDSRLLDLTSKLHNVFHNNTTLDHPDTAATDIFLKNYNKHLGKA